MNPDSLYTLTPEQKKRYLAQPDNLQTFSWNLNGDQEAPFYIEGTKLRFWLNIQNFEYQTHWHSFIEIIVPLEECYYVTVQQKHFILQPGDILVIPSGDLHSLSSPPTGSRFIFLIDLNYFDQLQGYSYLKSLISQPIYITCDICPDLYQKQIRLIMCLADHYWSKNLIKDFRIQSCLLNFFANYGEHFLNQEESFNDESDPRLAEKLNTVFNYLDSHYAEPLTLEHVASIANFSKFYFSRLFKRCTNQTFYDYLSCKRIKAAESLLITPNLAITEISLMTGFSSISSFNRTFKRIKGCTPSEYRSLYSNHV